jgi:phospholipid-translocating ATPase
MLGRHHHDDNELTDDEDDHAIDPELRLRTVRTAASALTESVAVEQRAAKRKNMINKSKKGSFFRRGSEKNRVAAESTSDSSGGVSASTGPRRNIYVNCPISPTEADSQGEPTARYPRNKVRTTSKFSLPSCLDFSDHCVS